MTNPEVVPLRCSILRGGTSRGVFFNQDDLPSSRTLIEAVLLDVFGSPDVRQIDGLGGATSQTSKAAIIGPPSRSDADVDYTFAQVGVGAKVVDWGGNCGNLSAAVGPFAIDRGLVHAIEPTTVVRIHNTNTSKIIVAHVPTLGGRAQLDGAYIVPGVPGSGARILLDFADPAGSITGKLLPTGNALDHMELQDGRGVDVSIVDAGNPTVFLRAEDLGLTGIELPTIIASRTDITDTLEAIRATAAEWLGLVVDRRDATRLTPGLPKIGFVSAPASYVTISGTVVEATEFDLAGRLMSMQAPHSAYMTTAAIATAAAAFIEGTVVSTATRPRGERKEADTIRIGHPYGVMHAAVRADDPADPATIRAIGVGRTARHILDGIVWVRSGAFRG